MARFYELYECIEKGPKFIQLLNESRAALVLEEWQSFDIDVHVSFESSFVNWITHFLMNTLYESLVADSMWIINIIPNPEHFQLDYLGHVFIKLGPEIQKRLFKMYEKNPSIKGVKDVYEACVGFGSNVEKYLQNVDSNTTIDVYEVGKWGLDLYKCFSPFQVDYVTYEREYTLDFLTNKISDSIKTKNYLVILA